MVDSLMRAWLWVGAFVDQLTSWIESGRVHPSIHTTKHAPVNQVRDGAEHAHDGEGGEQAVPHRQGAPQVEGLAVPHDAPAAEDHHGVNGHGVDGDLPADADGVLEGGYLAVLHLLV